MFSISPRVGKCAKMIGITWFDNDSHSSKVDTPEKWASGASLLSIGLLCRTQLDGWANGAAHARMDSTQQHPMRRQGLEIGAIAQKQKPSLGNGRNTFSGIIFSRFAAKRFLRLFSTWHTCSTCSLSSWERASDFRLFSSTLNQVFCVRFGVSTRPRTERRSE